MELTLKREVFTDKSTIGSLSIEGKFECYILEDPDRGLRQDMPLSEIKAKKEAGNTAIPYGRYRIKRYMSPHFKKMMPLLIDVPGYAGILMHVGNTPKDTLGCLLAGRLRGKNMISESTIATAELDKKIEDAEKRGEEIWITITK